MFVTIYVSSGRPIWAGARTFNGAPGSGGGYAELDVTSVLADQGYRFQSTLVHELGHAFGLTHVTCHGDDLQSSSSIMRGNSAHWSSGLTRSATPGSLIREDRYLLAQAPAVFPCLTYEPAVHGADLDPDRLQRCFLKPMGETIGPLIDQPGIGFDAVSRRAAGQRPRRRALQPREGGGFLFRGCEARAGSPRRVPLQRTDAVALSHIDHSVFSILAFASPRSAML